MLKVCILEDDRIMRDRLSEMMRSWDYVSNVMVCSTIAEMQSCLNETSFDVFLADIHLDDGDSIGIIEKYQDSCPGGVCIVISASSDPRKIFDALCAGAVGYLHKDDSSIAIIKAIKVAIRGESILSPGIARQIVNELRLRDISKRDASIETIRHHTSSHQTILSDREVEVINLLSKGLTNEEVATVLEIATSTIAVHVRNIYKKLGVSRRVEALYEARSMGLIE